MPFGRRRAAGAGREPRGASDQDRGQSGASGQPRRDRRLRAGGDPRSLRSRSLADASPTAARCAAGATFLSADASRRSAAQKARQGAGLRILTETVTSPTLAEQMATDPRGAIRRRKWHQWDPVARDGARAAAAAAAGGRRRDLPLRQSRRRRLARRRLPRLRPGQRALRARLRRSAPRDRRARRTMNRLYAVESTPSLTGAKADHRLPLRAARDRGLRARSSPRRSASAPPARPRARSDSRQVGRRGRQGSAGASRHDRSSSPATISRRPCTRSRTR